MITTRMGIVLFLSITALVVLAAGCGEDDPASPAPVAVDPFAIELTRTAWTLPSRPIHGRDGTTAAAVFDPRDRVQVIRWFRPKERVPRRYLDPDLEGQTRDDTHPVMDLYLRAEDGDWNGEDWGGIMHGVANPVLNLESTHLVDGVRFVEVWVNDRENDPERRSGRLHIDFGLISEDGFWPEVDDRPQYGTCQDEDANGDGIFTQDEDVGLGGICDGRRYYPDFGVPPHSPYPAINSTARNGVWDREDPNANGSFEQANAYYTWVIDLGETEALVDVWRDYGDGVGLPVDQAWRLYRIPLNAALTVGEPDEDLTPDRIRFVRIWFEDDQRREDVVWLQLSGLRFPGGP